MSCANLGTAAKAAPGPTPRMQAAPTARVPVMPTNSRTVGAAVPTSKPHAPSGHAQGAPMAAKPPAPSPRKRAPTAMAPAIPPAKRHAPFPRTEGAPMATVAAVPTEANVPVAKPALLPSPCAQGTPTGGVPLPTNSTTALPTAAHAAKPRAPGTPTGRSPVDARPSRSPPQVLTAAEPTPLMPSSYLGVHHDHSKGWMAYVFDPKRCVARDIGPFKDEHLAALAHDRVAIVADVHGNGERLNFKAAFHRIERAFLHRCSTMEVIDRDLCGIIEKGTYEARYSEFLTKVYRSLVDRDHQGDDQTNCDEFWDVILEFFIVRPKEIGVEALRAGGEKLVTRFVEMHRNKAPDPVWRRWYHQQLQLRQRMTMIQKQQQQQQMMVIQQQYLDGNACHAACET